MSIWIEENSEFMEEKSLQVTRYKEAISDI